MASANLLMKKAKQLPMVALLLICIICRLGFAQAWGSGTWEPWPVPPSPTPSTESWWSDSEFPEPWASVPEPLAPAPSPEPWAPSSGPESWAPSSGPEPWTPSSDPEPWAPSSDPEPWGPPSDPEPWAPSSDEPWAPSTPGSWVPPFAVSDWTPAHATFYGGDDASGTMGGACGYGDLYTTGYGTATAALSPVLFNGGMTCGACFAIKCDIESGTESTKWCLPNAGSITVTGTNLCPENWARTDDGWCNPPFSHFDLAYPSFAKLADKVAGIIPVQYKRVTCAKQGGLKFQIGGNLWFNLVLVYNVGGAGNVIEMAMKGSDSPDWLPMTRNWGQKWEDHHMLAGQSLSFKVTTDGGQCLYLYNITDPSWQHDSTFTSSKNF